ncbi:MAG: hypothetical protein LBT55_01375 [Clostridiaceae bacterium]|jgi:hypothetical protein|nr:hypothetical protein [Clostridiaceae bacterium]
MESKLKVIRVFKTIFYLAGFPLLFLLALVSAMPYFRESVYSGYAANGFLFVLIVWGSVEVIRQAAKLFVKKNNLLRGAIAAVLALAGLLVPMMVYDNVYAKKTLAAVHDNYADAGIYSSEDGWNANWGWEYTLGHFRSFTSQGGGMQKTLINEYKSFSDFYKTSFGDAIYADTGSMNDWTYGNFGFGPASKDRIAAGEDLFVYTVGGGEARYTPYDPNNALHKNKTIFHFPTVEDLDAHYITSDPEAAQVGNSSAYILFEKTADGEYVALKSFNYVEGKANGNSYYRFKPKFVIAEPDRYGTEVFLGMYYGGKTILDKEITLLQGYVDAYKAAATVGTVAEDSDLAINYKAAKSGGKDASDTTHMSLSSLYRLEAKLSYQPYMFPILGARYFVYIFSGLVALSLVVVGYFEDKERKIWASVTAK